MNEIMYWIKVIEVGDFFAMVSTFIMFFGLTKIVKKYEKNVIKSNLPSKIILIGALMGFSGTCINILSRDELYLCSLKGYSSQCNFMLISQAILLAMGSFFIIPALYIVLKDVKFTYTIFTEESEESSF